MSEADPQTPKPFIQITAVMFEGPDFSKEGDEFFGILRITGTRDDSSEPVIYTSSKLQMAAELGIAKAVNEVFNSKKHIARFIIDETLPDGRLRGNIRYPDRPESEQPACSFKIAADSPEF